MLPGLLWNSASSEKMLPSSPYIFFPSVLIYSIVKDYTESFASLTQWNDKMITVGLREPLKNLGCVFDILVRKKWKGSTLIIETSTASTPQDWGRRNPQQQQEPPSSGEAGMLTADAPPPLIEGCYSQFWAEWTSKYKQNSKEKA